MLEQTTQAGSVYIPNAPSLIGGAQTEGVHFERAVRSRSMFFSVSKGVDRFDSQFPPVPVQIYNSPIDNQEVFSKLLIRLQT